MLKRYTGLAVSTVNLSRRLPSSSSLTTQKSGESSKAASANTERLVLVAVARNSGLSNKRLGKLPAHVFARSFSTSSSVQSLNPNSSSSELSNEPGSLFRSSSTWDHVFEDIDNMPPLSPLAIRSSITQAKERTQPPAGSTKRQAMTVHEAAAVAKMFNYAFDVNDERRSSSATAAAAGTTPKLNQDPLTNAGLGFGPPGKKSRLAQYLEDLERIATKKRVSAAKEVSADRLKEQIENFDTDAELLEWAIHDVFSHHHHHHHHHHDVATSSSSSTSDHVVPGATKGRQFNFTYGKAIALLMEAFRDKFHDPHLALSIFQYAKNLSIDSFVAGCTSFSYHELLVTLWTCFRDLKGVRDTLEEMHINGIQPYSATRNLVESIRREIISQTPLSDKSEATMNVLQLLTQIDSLIAKKRRPRQSHLTGAGSGAGAGEHQKSQPWREEWKSDHQLEEGYEFGNWDEYSDEYGGGKSRNKKSRAAHYDGQKTRREERRGQLAYN